jgi:glycosyltransferase involved in cell wall biosynthesis
LGFFKLLISIIIPTYNRLGFLKKAIASVQNQSYKNFELIIVDDGSTDDTRTYLETLSDVKFISQENLGVASARNAGIKKATGEWIAFLDSDDIWLPHKLETQVSFLLSNKQYKWVHSNELWFREGLEVKQLAKHKKGGGDQFLPCIKECVISPSTVLIHKDLLNEVDAFDEEMVVCEDYDLWLKLTSIYEVGFIEDALIHRFGGHADQLSMKYFAMDYFRIKSLDWVLRNRLLSEEKSEAVKALLIKKAKRLLKGYEKHGNMSGHAEILSILNFVS